MTSSYYYTIIVKIFAISEDREINVTGISFDVTIKMIVKKRRAYYCACCIMNDRCAHVMETDVTLGAN